MPRSAKYARGSASSSARSAGRLRQSPAIAPSVSEIFWNSALEKFGYALMVSFSRSWFE